MSGYLFIIEPTATGYSAYSPDLPGCIAAGGSREELDRLIREAVDFHIEELRLAGEAVPQPSSMYTFIEPTS